MIAPYEIKDLVLKYRKKAEGLKGMLKGYADGTPLSKDDEIEVSAQLHEVQLFLKDLGILEG